MHHDPVLIVEIHASVGTRISSSLKAVGFEVRKADLGGPAPIESDNRAVDVDLLDLSTPRIGETVAAQAIRSLNPSVVIIVVTDHCGAEDKAGRLYEDARDAPREHFPVTDSIARLLGAIGDVFLPHSKGLSCLQVGDIRLDAAAHRVTKAEQNVHLTPKEFKLLHVLMEHEGLPLTHHQLLELVWGSEHGSKRDYLRTYISQLRRKLETNPAVPKYLLTENHMGYRFQQP